MKSINGVTVPNTSKNPGKKKVATIKNINGVKKPVAPKPVETVATKPQKTFKPGTKEDFSLGKQKERNKTEKEKLKLAKKAAKKQAKLAKKNKKAGETVPKKTSKVRVIIASILLVIVLALTGAVVWAILWGNDLIAKMTGGNGNVLDLMSFLDDHYEPLKTDATGRTNILAFGTSGYDMNGSEGGGSHAGWSLADSIMMISISQENGNIAMSTLPRDLKISGYRCTATGKVNEIYYCASSHKGTQRSGSDEQYGAQMMMEEVGKIYGIEFQYYVHVNWGSLIALVNTLGGITVTLDENVNDWYYTGTKIQAGVPTTLNGDQALALARARHGTSTGDFARGKNQQAILAGIKDKIYEKDLSLLDILNLANILGDNLRTNLSLAEIKTAAKLTFEFDFNKIKQLTLLDYTTGVRLMKTANINGISYVIPSAGDGNWSAIQAFIREQLDILNNEKEKTYQEIIEEEQKAAQEAAENSAEETVE